MKTLIEEALDQPANGQAIYTTMILTRAEWESYNSLSADIRTLLRAKAENLTPSLIEAARERWGK